MVAPGIPVSSSADTQPTSDVDHLRSMERLMRAVQELSLARTLPEIQRIVGTSARELVGCDGATFVLREDDNCYYADEDAIAPLWKGSRFPINTCIGGWSMQHRRAVVIPDIYADDRVPHAAYLPTFIKSLVMVPIRQLAPVGAIGAYWAEHRDPSPREVALLQALANSTSIAMEHVQTYSALEERVRDRTADLEKANEEIRQLLLTDELTGLNNRRGFWLLAEPALRAARSGGRDCVLAFLDVDGLKEVNDSDGHDAGDALIDDTAQILRIALHPSDIVGRIGGDEFCVLVTESGDNPMALKDRLRDAFETFNDTADRPYQLSISMGLQCVPAADTASLDELLAQADALMYEDKKSKARPVRGLAQPCDAGVNGTSQSVAGQPSMPASNS